MEIYRSPRCDPGAVPRGRGRRCPPDHPSAPELATGGATATRTGRGACAGPRRGEGRASWTPASEEGRRWGERRHRP
jgi:hypothetical protein